MIDETIEPVGHCRRVIVLPEHLSRPCYRDRKLLTGFSVLP